ncbi:techylectin-5A-like [Haliotis asinina]|uniref:techylectin-5A-like n=1 Tax=Haliotis asinina TaxID=109174 RepID=UPI00353208FD
MNQETEQVVCINIEVIQYRYDGSQRFDRTWDEYKEGFGDLNKEFWLGNEKIRRLTEDGVFSLLIQIWDSKSTKWKAYYQNFSIGNSSMNYALQSAGFSGSAGDGLGCLQGQHFSVCGPDLDAHSPLCTDLSWGGWWVGSCHEVNLNGLYSTSGGNLSWMSHHTLMKTQMKLTPYI